MRKPRISRLLNQKPNSVQKRTLHNSRNCHKIKHPNEALTNKSKFLRHRSNFRTRKLNHFHKNSRIYSKNQLHKRNPWTKSLNNKRRSKIKSQSFLLLKCLTKSVSKISVRNYIQLQMKPSKLSFIRWRRKLKDIRLKLKKNKIRFSPIRTISI